MAEPPVSTIRHCNGNRVDVFPFQEAAHIVLSGTAITGNFFPLRRRRPETNAHPHHTGTATRTSGIFAKAR
jgi:hypothetical protein